MKRLAILLLALIIASFLTPSLSAQEEPLPDRFNLEIGGYFIHQIDVVAELLRQAGPLEVGGVVDFNQDLGLTDSVTVPRLDGDYRFNRRSAVNFSYWNIQRDATTFLGTGIDFGNISIPVGEEVYSFFDTQTLRFSYEYAFYNVPKAELGINVGLHITDIDLGISCVSCSDPNSSESAAFPAPLPVIGFNFRYKISHRWTFAGYNQHFMLDVGGFDGSLTDTRIGLSHHTFKNVGFGFGWNRIHMDVDVDVSDYRGSLETKLEGIQAYVVLSFGKFKYPED
jgi:hypothetical protein